MVRKEGNAPWDSIFAPKSGYQFRDTCSGQSELHNASLAKHTKDAKF